MKTLIAYSTLHGCTEKISKELKELLGGDVTLVNLKKEHTPELKKFQRVIIGGSIHAGRVQKSIKVFCQKNLIELKKKELGLFITCMETGQNAEKQLSDAFPEELLEIAKSTACLGGEFNFDKMNFLQKMIVKKVAHVNKSISKINYDAIQKFSKRMDRIFNPFLFLA